MTVVLTQGEEERRLTELYNTPAKLIGSLIVVSQVNISSLSMTSGALLSGFLNSKLAPSCVSQVSGSAA